MTTRVVLDASAVKALIDLDKEPFALLAKNATEQVAEALARKLVNKDIDAKVDASIREVFARMWRSPEVGVIVIKAVDRAVEVLLAQESRVKALADKSVTLAESKLDLLVEKKISEKVDALITRRLQVLMKMGEQQNG